jgi:DNA-binding NarL/FixJ family response regulator
MEPNEPYRIVIADDHAVVRRGVRAVLESQPGIEICAEASDGLEAVDSIKKEKPDLLVLDLTMPGRNGLEVIRSVREESPSTDILVLTMHFSEELARECLSVGARAYILKSDADTELVAAVDSLRYHQRPYFTCQLAVTMTKTFARGSVPGVESATLGTTLTERELDVLQLLASGKSNKEAAGVLDVSTRTIESHRNHIMKKMKFGSFSDLVRFAVRHNLIDA